MSQKFEYLFLQEKVNEIRALEEGEASIEINKHFIAFTTVIWLLREILEIALVSPYNSFNYYKF